MGDGVWEWTEEEDINSRDTFARMFRLLNDFRLAAWYALFSTGDEYTGKAYRALTLDAEKAFVERVEKRFIKLNLIQYCIMFFLLLAS